jgi:hypothetical protein
MLGCVRRAGPRSRWWLPACVVMPCVRMPSARLVLPHGVSGMRARSPTPGPPLLCPPSRALARGPRLTRRRAARSAGRWGPCRRARAPTCARSTCLAAASWRPRVRGPQASGAEFRKAARARQRARRRRAPHAVISLSGLAAHFHLKAALQSWQALHFPSEARARSPRGHDGPCARTGAPQRHRLRRAQPAGAAREQRAARAGCKRLRAAARAGLRVARADEPGRARVPAARGAPRLCAGAWRAARWGCMGPVSAQWVDMQSCNAPYMGCCAPLVRICLRAQHGQVAFTALDG